MPFLRSALVFLVALGALTLGACGVSEDGGTLGGEPALTAELVVPPAEQELVSATAAPTATAVPTVIDTPAGMQRVNVANRGYNVKGSDEAPITLFEFSDFI